VGSAKGNESNAAAVQNIWKFLQVFSIAADGSKLEYLNVKDRWQAMSMTANSSGDNDADVFVCFGVYLFLRSASISPTTMNIDRRDVVHFRYWMAQCLLTERIVMF
jgi:hypothetical protein